jgi:hypothetical protein
MLNRPNGINFFLPLSGIGKFILRIKFLDKRNRRREGIAGRRPGICRTASRQTVQCAPANGERPCVSHKMKSSSEAPAICSAGPKYLNRSAGRLEDRHQFPCWRYIVRCKSPRAVSRRRHPRKRRVVHVHVHAFDVASTQASRARISRTPRTRYPAAAGAGRSAAPAGLGDADAGGRPGRRTPLLKPVSGSTFRAVRNGVTVPVAPPIHIKGESHDRQDR